MVIIHKGEVVADGTAAELERQGAEAPPIILRLKADGAQTAEIRETLARVEGVSGVEERGSVAELLEFRVAVKKGADARPHLPKAVADAGWTLFELRRDALDLESIFRRLTRQS